MTDLFGDGQISLFGDGEDRIPHPKQADYVPDLERIRQRLHAVLDTARAAPDTPWPDKKRRMWQTVFPNMSKWLPDDERDQLCFEFARGNRAFAGLPDSRIKPFSYTRSALLSRTEQDQTDGLSP